jgi:peroxiredoxin
MKTILISFLFINLIISSVKGEGYNVGDKATDFKLKNIDGKFVSLSDFPAAKGFVVVFTCNHCPFAKAYQDRIIALDKEYKSMGFPVIAINPNDPSVIPEDSYEAMQVRAKEAGFTFPYLIDESQQVYKTYGAVRTPHVFLLQKERNGDLVVKYIGAIDDNYQDASAVTQTYLKNAIDDLIAGRDPVLNFTKAIGCTIKAKE